MRKIKVVFFISLFLSPILLWNNTLLKGEDEESVRLIVGETKIFSTRAPTRVVIAKPSVADIVDVTDSEITVSAKAPGATTLVYWDSFGEQSIKIRVIQEDMNEVKRRVDNMLSQLNLSEVYTKAEDEENKVILLGRVKNSEERDKITLALGPLKEKTVDLISLKEEEAIVDIDVQVLELDKDATNTLGLTNPLSTTSGYNITEVGSAGISSAGASWGDLFKIFHLQRPTAFSWTLYALVQEGKARVLSRPRLSCQSGKYAELLVGGEKPVFTTSITSTVGTSTNVEYKEFGIKLKIKPQVTEDKRIKLGLNVEVSEVGAAEFIGLTTNRTAQAYPLSKRTASTELYLDDGQTMAIGGLMKQKDEEDITKTPWLSDLPVLGALFRKKVSKVGGGLGERGNVELFITLTPRIVSKETPEGKLASSQKILQKEAASFQKTDIPLTLTNYTRAVQTKIVKAIYYPQQAKDAGWEGSLKLSLNITANGFLKETTISQSSGYKVLDDAALEVAYSQAPYPPFPPQIDSQELWVDVPIVYKKN